MGFLAAHRAVLPVEEAGTVPEWQHLLLEQGRGAGGMWLLQRARLETVSLAHQLHVLRTREQRTLPFRIRILLQFHDQDDAMLLLPTITRISSEDESVLPKVLARNVQQG